MGEASRSSNEKQETIAKMLFGPILRAMSLAVIRIRALQRGSDAQGTVSEPVGVGNVFIVVKEHRAKIES